MRSVALLLTLLTTIAPARAAEPEPTVRDTVEWLNSKVGTWIHELVYMGRKTSYKFSEQCTFVLEETEGSTLRLRVVWNLRLFNPAAASEELQERMRKVTLGIPPGANLSCDDGTRDRSLCNRFYVARTSETLAVTPVVIDGPTGTEAKDRSTRLVKALKHLIGQCAGKSTKEVF